ncbi:MAG: YlxM family DNA-binding protein [Firmicutes bacterium]|nr:YlxM family DNA-binding protein [Bacillota bacterium]MDD7601458.1 YlxM family DNA-binding protein [Bacillota bacterium]MDY5857029.1 YlxM family DNA-binding protein [Anaerovoracaceae bacterium]
MDKIAETSLLYDFYGQLLTEKQRQVMSLYHEENLTLSEIADEFGISRQAVHDTLKKAEQSLSEYERKLGLVEKFVRSSQALEEIETEIDAVTEAVRKQSGSPVLLERLQHIKRIIAGLEEE